MSLGGKVGSLRRVAGDNRVDGVGRAVDKHLAAPEQARDRFVGVRGRHGYDVEHARHRVVGRRRRLVHTKLAVPVLRDEVRECPTGIASEPHRLLIAYSAHRIGFTNTLAGLSRIGQRESALGAPELSARSPPYRRMPARRSRWKGCAGSTCPRPSGHKAKWIAPLGSGTPAPRRDRNEHPDTVHVWRGPACTGERARGIVLHGGTRAVFRRGTLQRASL